MKKNIIKSIVSFALALVLAAGLMPVTADAVKIAFPSYLKSRYGIEFGDVSITCSGETYTLGASDSGFVSIDCNVVKGTTMEVDIEAYFICPGCREKDPDVEEITVEGAQEKPYNCTETTGGTVTISDSGHKLSVSYSRTKVEHDYSYTPDSGTGDTHVRKCSRCRETTSMPCTPSSEPATCLKAQTCQVCSRVFAEKLDHNYSYSVSGKTITETCDKGCGQNSQVTLMRNDEVSLSYTGSAIKALKTEFTGSAPVASTAITYTHNVDVGTAKGSITMGGETVEETFEIAPAVFDSNLVGDYAGDYDGQPHGITVGELPAGTKIEYKESTAETYTETAVTRTELGTTTVDYRLTNPNYVSKEGTATITVNRASISTANIDITPAVTCFYSGSAQVPGVTVKFAPIGKLTEGTDYEVSWDKEGFIYPANYRLTVTGKGNFTGTGKDTYTIKNAPLTDVSVAQKNTLTYTGEALTPEVTARATTVDGAQVSFTYSTAEEGTYSAALPSFEEAGEHTVYFKATAANHNVYTDSFKVTVGKAEPTYAEPTAKSGLTYDGDPMTLVNGEESEHGTFQYRLGESGEWSNTVPTAVDGGSYTVYWKLIGDKNHKDKEGSVSATIGRSLIALTAADFAYSAPESLTYNGNEKTARVEPWYKTGVGEITVKYNGKTEKPKNAGVYEVSIDVAAGKNYEAATGLTADDWVFAVDRAEPEIIWEKTEFIYNGEKQGEAKVKLVDGETYNGTVNYSYGPNEDYSTDGLPTNVGTYVVRASIAIQENYLAAQNKVTITIKVKEVTAPTATLAAETYTHDGKGKTPAVKVFDGETEIPSAEYTVSYANNTAVGAATVTITDKPDGNYSFAAFNKVFVILPDSSALEGVTTENVNSGHQTAIDEIQAAMAGKDITGASDAAKDEWDAIAEHCTALEAKILDAETGAEAITAGTAALPQQPTTDDLHDILEMLEQYEAIEKNLTAAEKTALEDEIQKLEELNEEISDADAGLKEITDGVAELEEDPRVFADKATVKALLKKTKDLEDSAYLTDAEKTALAGAESKLKAMEAEFTAAEKVEADYLNKLPAANIGTKKSVDTYEAAKTAYEALGADKAKVDPKAVKKLTDFKNTLTDYKITKGSGTKWAKNGTSDLSFTANGYYPHFKGVKIDGKTIDAANYTAKAGSTIVTLKKEYLKTLKNGDHVVAITFGDGDYEGEATGIFRVIPSATTPATGDSILIPFMLMVLSMTGLAAMFVLKKRSC